MASKFEALYEEMKADIEPAETTTQDEDSPAPAVEEGIPQEVVAVIAAAVAAYGCGAAEIKAIRPLERPGWKQSGRFPSKNS